MLETTMYPKWAQAQPHDDELTSQMWKEQKAFAVNLAETAG